MSQLNTHLSIRGRRYGGGDRGALMRLKILVWKRLLLTKLEESNLENAQYLTEMMLSEDDEVSDLAAFMAEEELNTKEKYISELLSELTENEKANGK